MLNLDIITLSIVIREMSVIFESIRLDWTGYAQKNFKLDQKILDVQSYVDLYKDRGQVSSPHDPSYAQFSNAF